MRHDDIFIDSSMFKAIIDEKDEFHVQGVNLWERREEGNIYVTNNFIFDESCTLIRTRCGLRKVFEFRNQFFTGRKKMKIERVTTRDEAEAWKWFEKDWKSLSFTDCICFAMMGRLGLKKVATFDRHFQKAGFICMPS